MVQALHHPVFASISEDGPSISTSLSVGGTLYLWWCTAIEHEAPVVQNLLHCYYNRLFFSVQSNDHIHTQTSWHAQVHVSYNLDTILSTALFYLWKEKLTKRKKRGLTKPVANTDSPIPRGCGLRSLRNKVLYHHQQVPLWFEELAQAQQASIMNIQSTRGTALRLWLTGWRPCATGFYAIYSITLVG